MKSKTNKTLPESRKAKLPKFISPQLATLLSSRFTFKLRNELQKQIDKFFHAIHRLCVLCRKILDSNLK